MKIALVVTGLVLTIIVNGTSALQCNYCESTKDMTCQGTEIEQGLCDGVCFEGEFTVDGTKFFARGCTNEFDDARCGKFKLIHSFTVADGCSCTEDLCNDGTLGNDDDNGGKNQDDNSNGGTHHFSSITFVIGVMSTVLIVKNFFIANIL
ncbi:hypothetical protein ACF0H5_012574 [Mactra antiquata]